MRLRQEWTLNWARSTGACGILAHPGFRRWPTSSRGLTWRRRRRWAGSSRKGRTMSTTTVFLGRLLGLYLVAISVGMLANRRPTLDTLDDMARSEPWMLFSGMVATGVGLAVVLSHQVWSGGALPIVVTLVGWAALLKGIVLLLVPAERVADAYKGIGFERFFQVWMVVVLAIGLWTAAVAFTA